MSGNPLETTPGCPTWITPSATTIAGAGYPFSVTCHLLKSRLVPSNSSSNWSHVFRVGVALGVGVAVDVKVRVGELVAVREGVFVLVGLFVGVFVAVSVLLGVLVAVSVGVLVFVWLFVGV